jgi:hypothetical protein
LLRPRCGDRRLPRCASGPANSIDFAIALRDAGQPLRIEHDDHHLFGVFPDATWRRLIDDSVSSSSTSTTPDADERVVFGGPHPAGRENSEAG